MCSIKFELPWPPSANHAWRPTASGGKILSEGYASFKKAVGDRVLEHRIRRHWTKDRLAVALKLNPPNNRDYDIDNRAKCCLDAIAAAGVIENDKFIDLLLIVRGNVSLPHGSVQVRIEEMSLPSFSAMGDFKDYFYGSPMMRSMSKPAKPRRIDVENSDEVILLALSAVFTAAAILSNSEQIPTKQLARTCVECADALIDAVVAQRKP